MSKTDYQYVNLSLSEGQQESLAAAVKAKEGVTLRVNPSVAGPHVLPVTKSQKKNMLEHVKKDKMVDLTLSKTQLQSAKVGGFAWLLPLIAAAAAPLLGEVGKAVGKETVKLGEFAVKKIRGNGAKKTPAKKKAPSKASKSKKGSGLIAPGKKITPIHSLQMKY